MSHSWSTRAQANQGELSDDTLKSIHRWWRAANYLAVGQIYLMANPLLREELRPEHIKPRLLGHWGTTPGLNFLYAHINRVISERLQETLYITGPGHGGPAVVASTYLEGTYTDIYPRIGLDETGMGRLFKQFSFPGGIPSHAAPETPGSINEGGELGYSLSHAYGAVFDNPDLLAFTVIGDGEAETGPLATSWHSNKFLNPVRDGVVLPVLHLNGYKIANPTVLARIPESELLDLMRGYGHNPHVFTAGFDDEDPISYHRRFAQLLDDVMDEIAEIRRRAAEEAATGHGAITRPRWPMIIFRTPKGWTGPKEVDGQQTEGSWRSHQVPLASARDTPEHLAQLRDWLTSYDPGELFDDTGAPAPDIAGLAPPKGLRMGELPAANGGLLRKPLELPDFRDFGVEVAQPGGKIAEATKVLGEWFAAVAEANPHIFRVFGPDETASNRLQDLYEVTDKQWVAEYESPEVDQHLARAGQVLEVLSEHQCQGWLEGYLLTGRHGVMNSYEAFIHIVDSMFNQHAKWLKVTNELEWRAPIASLNYLLSSHVWRQDHNGFSHQDPGFIDHVVNKKAEVVRVYLPPDANTLLSTFDHCLRSTQYVNVVVCGKQPNPNWLTMEEAVRHCTRGVGIWPWAGTEVEGEEPDVVLGCAGDIPTVEVLAAASILRTRIPDLKVRVVNVVDLMRMQDDREHPHGLSHRDFDGIFTANRPIIFAYHGYPWLIHRLTYRRNGHGNLHVRGYKEEGTTTTPFDMVMRNDLDRYHLVADVIDRVPRLGAGYAGLRQEMMDKRLDARMHAYTYGNDIDDVRNWVWPDAADIAEEGAAQEAIDTGADNI
ncbi:MAG TPA: phosphoketolase family protein [Beutenbergiaceae bacterium]|nr:phosphoketolase family protein [Beutenbergiaceae bacterium]